MYRCFEIYPFFFSTRLLYFREETMYSQSSKFLLYTFNMLPTNKRQTSEKLNFMQQTY